MWRTTNDNSSSDTRTNSHQLIILVVIRLECGGVQFGWRGDVLFEMKIIVQRMRKPEAETATAALRILNEIEL